MIEIETKAVLENPADIGSKLAALGYEFSEPIVQEDEIFFRDGDEVKGLWLSKTVLRIRTVNDRHTLTVKQHRCDDSDQFN
ncbi:MAG: hypothetical protein HKM24_07100, partial [Gammaproteobacteria bacterium]|nr:hypothetical protein [Gammaproteobacteria bacterium]